MSQPAGALGDLGNPTHVEDVQGRPDSRRITIDKVGIRGLRHPISVMDRSGVAQNTVATLDMYVNLHHEVKGAHMSRFVALLNDDNGVLTVHSFNSLLNRMVEMLGTSKGYIEARFPYFVNKSAPVTGVRSLMDYEVTLKGQAEDGVAELAVKVVVPVTSLCPCSKEISDYGAHNQRSHVTVTAVADGGLWIEDIIDLVENQASCEIYGLLKRPDEKFITERAYDNPKFVEDMVRDVAAQLDADSRVRYFMVESENFESIHNHSAYALIETDKRVP